MKNPKNQPVRLLLALSYFDLVTELLVSSVEQVEDRIFVQGLQQHWEVLVLEELEGHLVQAVESVH